MAAGDLTYRTKEATTCPICGKKFCVEKLTSGGGRLVSKDLTPELRRTYVPTEKYGEVFPAVYTVVVCPLCLFATYSPDFNKIKQDEIYKIKSTQNDRSMMVKDLFSDVDFLGLRRLPEGVASYLLAISCYDQLGPDKTPSIRQGMSALRAAWLLGDLHARFPNDNYDYLAKILYRKASFFYRTAVQMELDCKERISEAPGTGPDTDKNYGFDGILYLYAYLEFAYGPKNDSARRLAQVKRAKNFCGRIFGMGRSNKEKPAVLLDRARDLYDELSSWIRENNGGKPDEGEDEVDE